LGGAGFILEDKEAQHMLRAEPALRGVLKAYRNGNDFTKRPRNVFLIDFGMMNEEDARGYPVLYDIVRDRVKPERDARSNRTLRVYWWRFERPREQLREALVGLDRYIVTPETSKHRLFEFLDSKTAPDNSLIVVASADAFVFGVLSSTPHAIWGLAAGSRLGIDGTPRYNKGLCFESFPFPDPATALRARIGSIAEKIDAHRKAALARSEKVGMTVMYNVVDKLRAGEPLSKAERQVHELAACGTLRDLHDELDRLVAEAYGWPWPEPKTQILGRLVALHDQRVEEERAGTVRWLRPDYQKPRFAKGADLKLEEPGDAEDAAAQSPGTQPAPVPWPIDAIGQITALRALVAAGPLTVDEAVERLAGARRDLVARHLETLAILGEVIAVGQDQYADPAR
jgi:hypothetical protein